jgi:hypothetical protein
LITSSNPGINDFYFTNTISEHHIINSFTIPSVSIRGFNLIENSSELQSLNNFTTANIIYNLNTDVIYQFFNLNFFSIGLITSFDSLFLHINSQLKTFYTTGFGLYIEAGLKNIFRIPVILQIYFNPADFSKYSFHLEIYPYKFR